MSTRKLPRAPFTPPVELPGGRYFRLFELGRGGMASVELVVRSGPRGAHECFALKRPRRDVAQEPEVRAMFEEEVRNFRLLRHPNLVELVERLDDEGSPALVMEYIDGVTYDRLLDHDGFATHVFVLIEVLKGLEFLHGVRDTQGERLGLVHRDVSPNNIMIARDGRVKLLDFGIAKSKRSLVHTDVGVVKGKQGYMAPEQARGERVDARADLYAVGVMLREVSLHARRSDGGGPARFPAGAPTSPGAASSDDVPSRVAAICQRALAPEAAGRFPSAAAFREALESLGVLADRAGADALSALVGRRFGSELRARQERIESARARLPRGLGGLAFAETQPAFPAPAPAEPDARGDPSGAGASARRTARHLWPALGVSLIVALAALAFVGSRKPDAGSRGAAVPAVPAASNANEPRAAREAHDPGAPRPASGAAGDARSPAPPTGAGALAPEPVASRRDAGAAPAAHVAPSREREARVPPRGPGAERPSAPLGEPPGSGLPAPTVANREPHAEARAAVRAEAPAGSSRSAPVAGGRVPPRRAAPASAVPPVESAGGASAPRIKRPLPAELRSRE